MRKRTMIFGMPVLLLAFGFMFASCDSSVDVRDRAVLWGVSGAPGRGLADSGIYITVTGVPVDFRHDSGSGVSVVDAWRIVGTQAEWEAPSAPGSRPNDAFQGSGQIFEHASTTSTGLRGRPVTFDTYGNVTDEIANSGSFRLYSTDANALTGEFIIRFSLTGQHPNVFTTISGRVYQARVTLDASNSISFGSLTRVAEGATTDSGDARPWQSPDTPPSSPGVTLPSHPHPELGGGSSY
jgi:hypothetical protein